MIDRKIWTGDILWLEEGNSFWGFDEVVRHRAGYATATQDSEAGESLVDITGGYTVKRSDLRELNSQEGRKAAIICQLSIPEALNGIDAEERAQMAAEFISLIGENA